MLEVELESRAAKSPTTRLRLEPMRCDQAAEKLLMPRTLAASIDVVLKATFAVIQ